MARVDLDQRDRSAHKAHPNTPRIGTSPYFALCRVRLCSGDGREAVQGPDAALVSPQVFIVEDDEAVRDSLRMLLQSYGLEVEDYACAADFARGYRPGGGECLILDQHLPGVTGLDFLACCEGAALPLPAILLTGQGDGSIRDRADALGVCAYLEKPVPEDILLAAIGCATAGGAPAPDTERILKERCTSTR